MEEKSNAQKFPVLAMEKSGKLIDNFEKTFKLKKQ